MKQIFLHGLGQTPASWEKTICKLETAENAVCPSLPELIQGKPATYANLYKAFSSFCEEMGTPVDLCGLSLGGILALNYAEEHPERVNSLVLIGAPYKMPKHILRFQNAVFRFLPSTSFAELGFDKSQFLQLCSSMADLDFTFLLPRISCPVLVLCGQKDLANKSACRKLAQLVQQGRFQSVDGCGHEVNAEAPEALAALLRGFYDGSK